MPNLLKSLDRYVRTIDYFLLVIALICSACGLVLIYSAAAALSEDSSRFITVQSAAIVLGLIGFVVMSCVRWENHTRFWRIVLVVNILFQLSLVVFGYEDGGNRSWLRFAGIGIQPGEIGKLLFIFTFAKQAALYRRQINHWKSLLMLGLQLAVMVLAILIPSHDMGVALSYVFIAIAILFAAGLSLKWFAAGIAVIAAAAPVLWKFLSTAQKNRILVLIDPSIAPDAYWQQEQSRIAIGAGRLFGQGYLQGSQTQHNMLPEKQTDFIFAVAGEEWGLVGCLLILILLNLLIFRVFYVAYRADGHFLTLVCTGIGSMLLYQTYVNIFMCLGVGPVMGLPLPFFSYGGSAMVTSFLAIGVAAGVSMRTRQRRGMRLTADTREEEAPPWSSSGKLPAGAWSGSLRTLREKTAGGLQKLSRIKPPSLPKRGTEETGGDAQTPPEETDE
ncbi:MAG: rod shape-determining protein RodA [Clostridiales bacterium]|nr:rod shape-determining protein RodA [Clostridiales bacterium]